MEPVECRAVIRFLYLKGRTPQETFDEMKETYGDNALSYDLVKRWHREFKHGRKLFLKGKRFPDDAALISEVTSWLEDQPGVFYKNGLQSCIKRWEKCITLGGSYVEKD